MQAGVLQSQKQDLQSHTRRVLHEIITTDDSSKLDILYHTFNNLVDQLEEIRRSNVDRFSLLPTELLNQIFIYYCLGERPQEPFVLLLVCKHWLNVVTHCPDLWTRLFVSLDEVNWQECMEAYCHYSRDRPLDVTLEFPFSKEELNHIAAKGHVGRWETLTIKSGSGTGSDMLNFPRRMREAPSVLYLLRNAEFPNLKNIDVRLKTAAAGSPMLWSNLFADTRSLDTVSVKHLLTSHLTVNLFFVDFPSLIDALKNLPGLVYLKFLAQRHPNVGATSGAQTAEDPIVLPSLRELYMDQQPHGMTLLRRLDSPKLQRLSFRLSMQEIPVFYQAVQNISSLKSLHLILYDVPSVAQLEESPPLDLEVLTLTHLSPLSPTDFRYLLGDDSKRGMSLLTLLQLFSSAKKVNITTDQMSIQWYNIISIFQRAEELFMSKTKTTNTRKQAKASPYTGDTILLSHLLSLYLEGDLCDTALSMIHSPNLHRLKIVEAKDISPERLTDFVMRSSYLRSLHLEAVSSPQANVNDTKSFSESIPVGLTDLSVTHEAQKMIQNLEFTGLETLRLMGALQGVTMQRGIFHFDQREIHLKPFLSSITSESPSIFANLVFLDLCVSNALFPVNPGMHQHPEDAMIVLFLVGIA
ncbi:hypothetical protein FRC20_009666 [Serendipita sp. 405]|nr:hypothetical protein FRC20_009666 [Serendipita sp. 405]